jgi:hypothetical protein
MALKPFREPCGKALGATQSVYRESALPGLTFLTIHKEFTRYPLQPSKNIKTPALRQENAGNSCMKGGEPALS